LIEIVQFVYLVAEVVDPERIILFGSYAYGEPDENSDLDLLVIKNDKGLTIDDEVELLYAVLQRKRQMNIKTRYDMFLNTEREAQMIAENGGAYMDALQKGKVVYERSHQ